MPSRTRPFPLRPAPAAEVVQHPPLTPAVLGSVAVVVAGSAAQLADYVLRLGLPALDSSQDGGVFGVVGEVAAASAAAASWLVLVRYRPRSAATVALPPLLTFVVVDEIVGLHDSVPHYLAVYAPILLGVFLCLAGIAGRLPGPAARVLASGLALLAVSFVVHVVGERTLAVLGLQQAGWATQVKAVIKHGCEVQGWLLVLIGLVSGIRRRRARC